MPSFMPSLNSFWALPRERASSGTFLLPKISRTTARTMSISGPPRFMPGLRRRGGRWITAGSPAPVDPLLEVGALGADRGAVAVAGQHDRVGRRG